MIEIRYRDIDPDTGEVSTDRLMCTCDDERIANWIFLAIDKDMSLNYDDPNREIYIKK